jgi:hypothetical protein
MWLLLGTRDARAHAVEDVHGGGVDWLDFRPPSTSKRRGFTPAILYV